MSRDLKPKQRIGQAKPSRIRRAAVSALALALLGAGGWAAYRYTPKAVVEVPVSRVRRGAFVISVKTRGEVRSANSILLSAPQVPDMQIVRLAESGGRVRRGEVIVEFDAAQQEQYVLERTTSVRTVDSEIVQLKASHKITDEQDEMNLMTAEYNLERAKLDASKAEVISEIEGAKYGIDVGISEGELGQVKTTSEAHGVAQEADVERLQQRKDKTVRDLNRAKGYLSNMVIYAPVDGIVHILPNFRASGSWGSKPPPFKEGDSAWTGAAIAEIPNLSEMRVELNLDEVDRGRLKLGQQVRVRVDAVPDKEFGAVLDWISPIAAVQYRGMGSTEKSFPAQARLSNLDDRLRPGMSASVEIIIESMDNVLLIPERSSFTHGGKPAVWVQKGKKFEIRPIEVSRRNETDLVVGSGLQEGEMVTLEDPAEAAKRAKKL